MSWLSHFTGWIGEKKNAILPIVTGLAGFAAGMIPGVGGALSKQVDKWGSKISGATDALEGLSGGGAASPNSPAVTAVEPASAPTTSLDAAQRPASAGNRPSPILIGGGILLAALLFGGSSNRR